MSPSGTPTPTPSPGQGGIAARYPGDKNISYDSDVILADDFEGYTAPSQLINKWTGAGPLANMRIATEAGNYYSGSKALEMTLPISAAEVVNNVGKKLATEQDVLFLRAYTKFDPGFSVTTSGHNGLRVSAHYPGGAGVKTPADGTGWFMFSVQNNKGPGIAHYPTEPQPGYGQVYAYWPKQRDNYGDHWYPDGWVAPGGSGLWLLNPAQYPDFKVMPVWEPERGKWYCYEIMVRANTLGKNDGEVAWWIDGQLKGRFPDLFLRSVSSLKIDFAALRLHALHSERVNKKWYDNVVIAKSYIGPMAPIKTVAVTIEWTPTTGDTYKLYYGTAAGQYLPAVPAGTNGSFVLDGLAPTTNYYFALTAVRDGIESGKSPEVSYTTTLQLKQRLKLNRKSRSRTTTKE